MTSPLADGMSMVVDHNGSASPVGKGEEDVMPYLLLSAIVRAMIKGIVKERYEVMS
jgi:hypothetical protein